MDGGRELSIEPLSRTDAHESGIFVLSQTRFHRLRVLEQ